MTQNIYIGYDPREDIAYQVCKHSITKLSDDVNVQPLVLGDLKNRGFVTRPDDPRASTEFTFTRFLVPLLNEYKGWALFCDCDFLFKTDVNDLFALADDKYAVMVVKHEYNVKDGDVKMDGQVQYAYPRKNWSSCILYNCEHPKNKAELVPEILNQVGMSFLHRFQWLKDEEIGEIPHTWNWLVGHYHEPKDGSPDAIHYTLGMPFMKGFENCEYASDWNEAKTEYYKDW